MDIFLHDVWKSCCMRGTCYATPSNPPLQDMIHSDIQYKYRGHLFLRDHGRRLRRQRPEGQGCSPIHLPLVLGQALDAELADLEHRVLVLAPHVLDVALSPLGLLHDAHGLALGADDARAAREQSLVQVEHLLAVVGGALDRFRRLERAFAGPDVRGAVQAQDVARLGIGY